MSWLSKICGKHWKDKKWVTLWHLSPDRHNVLMPRSTLGKGEYSRTGLYFTESFYSLLNDWMGFVAGKKKSEGSYSKLFLHKVIAPEWVIKKCHKERYEVFKAEDEADEALFGFWGWGQQTFMPEKFFPYIKLVSIDEYDFEELQDLYDNAQRYRHNIENLSDPSRYIGLSNTPEDKEKLRNTRIDNEYRRSKMTVQDEMKKRYPKDKTAAGWYESSIYDKAWWIAPDGTAHDVLSTHHQWPRENKQLLESKYNLSLDEWYQNEIERYEAEEFSDLRNERIRELSYAQDIDESQVVLSERDEEEISNWASESADDLFNSKYGLAVVDLLIENGWIRVAKKSVIHFEGEVSSSFYNRIEIFLINKISGVWKDRGYRIVINDAEITSGDLQDAGTLELAIKKPRRFSRYYMDRR